MTNDYDVRCQTKFLQIWNGLRACSKVYLEVPLEVVCGCMCTAGLGASTPLEESRSISFDGDSFFPPVSVSPRGDSYKIGN